MPLARRQSPIAFFSAAGEICDVEVGHMGDQVDVVLVDADRLDGRPQRGRPLQIDGDGPQHRIIGAGQARADTFIALLRLRELGGGELQGFADHLQDLDDLGSGGPEALDRRNSLFLLVFQLACLPVFAPNDSAFGHLSGDAQKQGFSDSIFSVFRRIFLFETVHLISEFRRSRGVRIWPPAKHRSARNR